MTGDACVSNIATDMSAINQLASTFIGAITGISFLGVLTRRGNAAGVLWGAVVGANEAGAARAARSQSGER